jgi:hypothetical protein
MRIFMIGTQRSGSNLFRLMLNQLPELAAPHPPHIVQRLMPLVPTYGDLADDVAWLALVDDVCRLVETNPVPWDDVTLDRDDIARRAGRRHLFGAMAAVYDRCGEAWGKRGWVCKSLANVRWANELADFFPQARFLYLYRDGRDVAVSAMRAVEGEKTAYCIAEDWARAQRLALALRACFPERVLSVAYERLVADPEATLRRVCAFVGARYDPAMLEFHATSEARKAAGASPLWENVTKPVMASNTRKFVTAMTPDDLRIFESVAAAELDALGYERAAIAPGDELQFSDAQIAAFRADNERRKARAWEELPGDDRERRASQRRLLDEIVARNARRSAVSA